MLKLPLSDHELKLLHNLIEKRQLEVSRGVRGEIDQRRSDLCRRGLTQSSASVQLAFAEALQGVTVLRRMDL